MVSCVADSASTAMLRKLVLLRYMYSFFFHFDNIFWILVFFNKEVCLDDVCLIGTYDGLLENQS
ncbi:hypothetical protein MUK42_08468 [Musa troglodytarum]|uniref:Uncharacterized protein n=1 Tax=Musa troglodytarum TaxID=320322 RepID=A0A9E7J8F6_9LILI|nr:hypothetical protein MUK42_08468 [Musa troglodytarum]